MNNLLSGKRSLITGATGGIGKAITLKLANEGCNLILHGQNKKKLQSMKREISSNFDIEVNTFNCDFSNEMTTVKSIRQIVNKFHDISILVNCAGVFPTGEINETSLDEFDRCFNINLKAIYIISNELFPYMAKRNWGRIINIGSSSSYFGFKGTAIYCSSKHALLGLSRSMHLEWKEYGIRVHIISPGSVKTKMGRKVKGQDFKTFIHPDEIAQSVIEIISYDGNMIIDEVRLNRMSIQ